MSFNNPTENTIIIMSDNRNPIVMDMYSAPYYSLATAINFEYSKIWGYTFRYYLTYNQTESDKNSNESLEQTNITHHSLGSKPNIQRRIPIFYHVFFNLCSYYLPFVSPRKLNENLVRSKNQPSCFHQKHGNRAAPWSKLICLYDTMNNGFRRIIYIDTDAIFNRMDVSLDNFLSNSTSTLASVDQASLILTFNYPWTALREANTGFQIWRNTEIAKEILRKWWNGDAGDFHFKHDYEQYNLENELLNSGEYRKHIAIIPAITFRKKRGQYVRHVGNDQQYLREPIFGRALKKYKISKERFEQINQEIAERQMIKINTEIDWINHGN